MLGQGRKRERRAENLITGIVADVDGEVALRGAGDRILGPIAKPGVAASFTACKLFSSRPSSSRIRPSASRESKKYRAIPTIWKAKVIWQLAKVMEAQRIHRQPRMLMTGV